MYSLRPERLRLTWRKDSQNIAHLVGQVNHELSGIGQAHDLAVVVHADDEYAAVGVGESRDPFEIFVPPGFLPLDVLVLFLIPA